MDAPRVLDVGVGSGAIALAIKDECARAHVVGVDTSADALGLARENAERTGVDVELREAGVEAVEEGWDLVVSNPPYVAPAEFDALAPELREWEPYDALVGEGLHEQIARRARTQLLVFEVGDGQAAAVAAILDRLGYTEIRMTPDLAGRDRVVEGRRP
jgi:release factor glutamine methyltransferase